MLRGARFLPKLDVAGSIPVTYSMRTLWIPENPAHRRKPSHLVANVMRCDPEIVTKN